MVNPEHFKQFKQGFHAWNAWRQKNSEVRPDLSGAYLRKAKDLGRTNLFGVDLRGADLRGADLAEAMLAGADLERAKLRQAKLRHAHLGRANCRGAELSGADLSGARLIDANLCGADLSGAQLIGACLRGANLKGADLRLVTLVDAQLDWADLTDSLLWETQRAGWTIKYITCQRAYWDREGMEATEYAEGEFERIFAEKPQIVLRYGDSMSSLDLIALPVIVERLQVEHPDSLLQIRSVQNAAGGASVTITVEDLKDRGTESFAVEFEKIYAELITTRDRLQTEERLRISFEAQCQVLVERVIPVLAGSPKQQINIGQLTAPITVERTIVNKGDTYNVSGQAGYVGPGGHAHDITFQQVQGGLDLPKLAEELGHLREAMKGESTGTREEDKAVGAVADAEEAAAKGDQTASLRFLKDAGRWSLKIAEKIGIPVAIEALKQAI